jgi:hypothetical protein
VSSSRSSIVLGSFSVLTACLLVATVTPAAQAEEAVADVAEPAPTETGYDKGFFVRTGDGLFELKATAMIQPRFELLSVEQVDPAAAEATAPGSELGDPTDRENTYAFQIARAQVKLGGHVYSEAVTYYLQTELGRGMPMLKDAWVDFRFVPDALYLRAGQFKRPFSRQWLVSATALEFVDRALTHGFFDPGRDIGIMLHDDYVKSPRFEWALALVNGHGYVPWFEGDVAVDPETGDGAVTKGKFTNVPDRFRPTIVARLGYNHGGIRGYSEADLEGGGLRFAVGASGLAELDAGDEGDSNVRAELDYVFKLRGFSSTGAAYVATRSAGDFADQAYDAWGLHAQLGYLIAGLFQPELRYALIDPEGDDDRTHRFLGGLAFFFIGHNVKLQIDGGGQLRESPDVDWLKDYLMRAQVQLAF